MAEERVTRCCVVGGGPAGMMLGLLLARAGIDVMVLEKHADFLRDFRGDTVHPSTLEVMHELGMLEDFLKLPHQEARVLGAQIGSVKLPFADFTHLGTRCKFIAFMPQWDFLNFLASRSLQFPSYKLMMQAEATDLILDGSRVAGVRARTPNGELEVRADLVVGTDGRHSIVREKAGLLVEELGAPMDVLWFRISRAPTDPAESFGRFDAGRIFILINRDKEWQFGLAIPKGTVEQMHARGLPAFRDLVRDAAPFVGERVGDVRSWDDVKLLSVRVDRLREWCRSGLLCIGDAAHAMSPIGGVGINLAIQDAVASANLLTEPLRRGRPSLEQLRRVQERREFPARLTQGFQVFIQNRVVSPVLHRSGPIQPPLALRLFARLPILQRIPARGVGIGVRPEHIRQAA